MTKQLPARPNLDHLRRQAKTLLAQLKDGDDAAARAFAEHLPAARGKKPAVLAAAAAKLKLADAQSVVARQNGYSSWPALARHVDQLRALEGEWHFTSLVVDGTPVPAAMTAHSRILIDGDRFRTESPEGTYEGIFTIDVEARPPRIDIEFVAGPEAGNTSYGLYELDGDELVLCLGVAGVPRPDGFAARAGSGHALERLHRASAARPANVTGGTPPPAEPEPEPEPVARESAAAFEVAMTPLLRRLEGEWAPVELVMDGKAMPAEWLAFGSRTMTGNEIKVVFGGKTMVHARVRIDERARPIAIDYLHLDGKQRGAVSLGIMDWIGDEARFLMARPGNPRPTEIPDRPRAGTLSRWRKRG